AVAVALGRHARQKPLAGVHAELLGLHARRRLSGARRARGNVLRPVGDLQKILGHRLRAEVHGHGVALAEAAAVLLCPPEDGLEGWHSLLPADGAQRFTSGDPLADHGGEALAVADGRGATHGGGGLLGFSVSLVTSPGEAATRTPSWKVRLWVTSVTGSHPSNRVKFFVPVNRG